MSPKSQMDNHNQLQSPTRLELWLLLASLLALYVPTYYTLDTMVWVRDGQGHGPVILALIGWLLWQRLPSFLALPEQRSPIQASISLLIGAALYVIGRSQEIMMLDTASHIFILGGIALYYKGWPGVKRIWFPLFFFIFAIPMPPSVVDVITAPLKIAVSHVAEAILAFAQYPVAREGVILYIGQYKLLVADACAGINSIFALEAIGVFYMSVVAHSSKARNILLAIMILPISFVSNVIRVCTLVLVTYYFGDEAGQGFVHGFAGIVLFMVATALTIAFDGFLGLFFKTTDPSGKPPVVSFDNAPILSGRITAFTTIIATTFAALIALGYAMQPQMKSVHIDQAELESMIPTSFGDWSAINGAAPLVSAAKADAPTFDQPYDAQVMRAYRNSANQIVMLAVAYGHNQRQDIKIHRPEVCYPAQGWQASALRPHQFPLRSSSGIQIEGMKMEANNNRGGREAVSYWIRIGDTFTSSGLRQRLHILSEGLKGKRADGILVRFSQSIAVGEPTEPAYQLQAQFAEQLLNALSPEARQLLTH